MVGAAVKAESRPQVPALLIVGASFPRGGAPIEPGQLPVPGHAFSQGQEFLRHGVLTSEGALLRVAEEPPIHRAMTACLTTPPAAATVVRRCTHEHELSGHRRAH